MGRLIHISTIRVPRKSLSICRASGKGFGSAPHHNHPHSSKKHRTKTRPNPSDVQSPQEQQHVETDQEVAAMIEWAVDENQRVKDEVDRMKEEQEIYVTSDDEQIVPPGFHPNMAIQEEEEEEEWEWEEVEWEEEEEKEEEETVTASSPPPIHAEEIAEKEQLQAQKNPEESQVDAMDRAAAVDDDLAREMKRELERRQSEWKRAEEERLAESAASKQKKEEEEEKEVKLPPFITNLSEWERISELRRRRPYSSSSSSSSRRNAVERRKLVTPRNVLIAAGTLSAVLVTNRGLDALHHRLDDFQTINPIGRFLVSYSSFLLNPQAPVSAKFMFGILPILLGGLALRSVHGVYRDAARSAKHMATATLKFAALLGGVVAITYILYHLY